LNSDAAGKQEEEEELRGGISRAALVGRLVEHPACSKTQRRIIAALPYRMPIAEVTPNAISGTTVHRSSIRLLVAFL